MEWIEIFANYLYGLRYIAITLMILMLFFAIDDFFVDLYYWIRRVWRALFVYRKRATFDEEDLIKIKEKPLAIMVPAWQEVGVVGKMAELATAELDYENYQIFVGTYPNDSDTQNDVDIVCERFPNVHKVVCARPGPTSKADCLNNIIASILQFEEKTKVKFAGFIMHDAEDVVSAMELRLFNYLLERKDLIQLPVYPFSRGPFHFTAGHYLDEFSEMHGKDIVVRESFVGQVPSAGVGTCFSRRAIIRLFEEGDGLPFDIQSLTEDYDIGFRMKAWGMEEVFVNFAVTNGKYATFAEKSISRSDIGGNVVCVREYFPETLQKSVNQKSRWIIGIVFQGFQVHKWTGNWKLNYFLWRDRKGVIAYFLSFLATLILLQVAIIWTVEQFNPDGYLFMSIFMGAKWIETLIVLNFYFFLNRIIQRMIFVRRYYGIIQALISPLRLLWSNLINFLATWRAIRQVLDQGGNSKRVAWDKTEHEYPTVSNRSLGHSLGSILREKYGLSLEQITRALEQRLADEKLGQSLLRLKIIDANTLGQALAEQANTRFEYTNPFEIDCAVTGLIKKEIALKYRILAVREEGEKLVVVGENRLSPVVMASLERQLERKIDYRLCQIGACTLGIRFHYLGDTSCNPTKKIEQLIALGRIDEKVAIEINNEYFSSQIQFGDALQQVGLIEHTLFNQIIMGFDYSSGQKLGDLLVEKELISTEVLEKVLALQHSRQQSIYSILAKYEDAQGSQS
jgi:adsorption protein B